MVLIDLIEKCNSKCEDKQALLAKVVEGSWLSGLEIEQILAV
jgi:hypothetical protein